MKKYLRVIAVALMMLLRLSSSAMAAAPATQPGQMELKLSYLTPTVRMVGQPPTFAYGSGFVVVNAKWATTFTDKDDVYYRAWITGSAGDWESANVSSDVGARQYAYLGTVHEGARAGASFKMSFGYRPVGLSSYPVEGRVTPLPEAMPLKPGKYSFTVTVQRIGPGNATESASVPLEITIGGDASHGVVSGLSDFQIIQRKDAKTGELTFRLVDVPSQTPWKAVVSKGEQSIATAEGTTSSAAESCTIPPLAVGGPYSVQIDAGQLHATYKDLYVGDLWIISGQSNAVGVGYEKPLYRGPMPGVHGVSSKYGLYQWGPAQDGFFENTMGPWVTAAQEFYSQSGVPVGLIGHAVGSKSIDYFYDASKDEPLFLRPLIERYGRGATMFLWYQGESDSFRPETWETYGPKLQGLVGVVRNIAKNPQMTAGIVQIARYTWQKDDHFAPVREAQRQFVQHDPHAVLYSTMPYEVNATDKIHLNSAGQAALGKQIAAERLAFEKTGKLESPGPVVASVKFDGADRKTIVVRFNNASGLNGKGSADEWFVSDADHRNFRDGGFVPIDSVAIDAEHGTVTLKLKSPAGDHAAVSYGIRADTGGTQVNAAGFPAACFVKVPAE